MRGSDRVALALRYTFSGGGGQLSSFMSRLAMLGLVLAVAVLLAVLSIMNGFDREMRERILSLVPHITVHAINGVDPSDQVAEQLLAYPGVLAASPFVQFQGLMMRERSVEAVVGLGLAMAEGLELQAMTEDAAGSAFLGGSEDGLLLGAPLAERLGIRTGQRLTLLVPVAAGGRGVTSTRTRVFTVHGLLRTGTELDENLAVVSLEAASSLAGLDGAPSGYRLHTEDIFEVAGLGRELAATLPPGYYLTNWTMTHGNLYAAIQLSRQLITLLLLSIIGVAAFNVVSSLVLVVIDKQGDIAILRTLGATPGDIATIFLCQGGLIGLAGGILGGFLGGVLSLAVPAAVGGVERLLGARLLATDVYPVSFIPVDLRFQDFALVSVAALVLCLIAALYPALRAARLAPADVLQRES